MRVAIRGCEHPGPTTQLALLGECEPFERGARVQEIACFTLCERCYREVKRALAKVCPSVTGELARGKVVDA